MSRLARINFNGGTRLMPARNRYDRELIFEEAEFCARRHGAITLELGNSALHIDHTPDAPQRQCSSCGEAIGNLLFSLPRQSLCGRCARNLS